MLISSFATTLQGSSQGEKGMPSIRDLVAAIRQREGVDAAIVLGRDGLLIDSQLGPGLDADDVAARIPAIIGPADELGAATERGDLLTAVLEHRNGIAVVSVLSPEAILLVLLNPRANIGQLLFELRRNREHIAALV
jgi:predicted regulator of Ras-like GTPase activity (Roadblock/LC7/MglB family)